ncbi:flagellar hook-associated protein FlgK [Chitinasiproducens palmae]|uniref:Flagellar hook-associated protein 1 n=1 Tax=Chitinasiproducens palmae TaxID=1770053 RepID=A0A1H2PJN0_9BURK|nr:flagellar hook-associated protein FlgK [Chitinasiproducens palmae]SDV46600.1 flagellar hook-associated protein 1 FlgK [Chitinasiproducens palmae]
MSSSLFGIGLSGINAAQYGLTTTGQNISNASTDGYTRESVSLKQSSAQYTGAGYLGTGVSVETVTRAYSQTLTTQLNNAQSTGSALDAYQTLSSSLDSLLGDPSAGIGAQMDNFLTAASTVASNPSSAAARESLLGQANTLASLITSTATQLQSLRDSVNSQLDSAVSGINAAAASIASLNTQIQAASATGQTPNSLLDERDRQVAALSKLVNVSVVTQSDGSYGVYVGSGQTLVMGSRSYALAAVPSTSEAGEQTVAYVSGTGDATQYLDESTLSGGTLGGLLSFRREMLDPVSDRVGVVAAAFAGAVNGQNEAGLTLGGSQGGALFTVGQPSVTAAPGNAGNAALGASIGDATALTGDNYTLSYDGKSYTLTNQTTGATSSPDLSTGSVTVDGVSYTLSGTMQAGDRFSIAPTRNAAAGFAVATSDTSAIAAASPVTTAAASTNAGTGTISASADASYFGSPLASAVTLSYSGTDGTLSGFPSAVTVSTGSSTTTYPAGSAVPYTAGASYAFGGVTLTLAGTPKTGDSFTVAANTALSGDGSNATAIGKLADAKVIGGSTLSDAYANLVTQVGTLAARVESSNTTQTTLITSLSTQQQSVSGVNLDEEAANLLQYQQMYQASSKIIQTATTLFDTILGLSN